MNITVLAKAVGCIEETMRENKSYLIELDQKYGDGDLGLSMADGFHGLVNYLVSCPEQDLGRAMMLCSTAFNEAAPSSLGTIISLFLMGMAKELKGKSEANLSDIAAAMESGVNKIMEKAKSKPGEKTILDALCPAVDALKVHVAEGWEAAFQAAAEAASTGSESTRQMCAMHGRAAYYGEQSIGTIDGGSVVGSLIFSSLNQYIKNC